MKAAMVLAFCSVELVAPPFGLEALSASPLAPGGPGLIDTPPGVFGIPERFSREESSDGAAVGSDPGILLFSNLGTAPTRIGSAEGPLAGSGLWAHMFYGGSPETLMPVGSPAEHAGDGWVVAGLIVVPAVCDVWGYAQMAAWDGAAWGAELAGVPPGQFGKTDIARIRLACYSGGPPPQAPLFTQSAIVPPIPEPTTLTLSLLGGGLLVLRRRWWGGCPCS